MAKVMPAITRSDFEQAKSFPVTFNGKGFIAEPKTFSTGSLGWYFNGKTEIEVNGKKVTVQVGMSIVIPHSKELPPKDEMTDSKAREFD